MTMHSMQELVPWKAKKLPPMKFIIHILAYCCIWVVFAVEALASAAESDPYSRVQGENFNASKRNECDD